ncbi:Anti-sigma-K factor rskA [Friedmanniella luteola]|uniref:Anti-sigma-K factor rskA n=1 Tax=Friedmanniella luteola TaxID=546871 RepID=A0A1H1ZRS0_9ACTN|nr:anti-sigma factor [Friedmanniella luteola]SDT36277.1 Anti-sigma-K factor rskA [Friedmanniella luteola]
MHTSPDLLALLALGEDVADDEDLVHVAGCPDCRAELAAFTAAAGSARRAGEATLVAPRPEVWQQISRELHLHEAVAASGPTAPPADPPGPAAQPGDDRPAERRRVRVAAFVLAAALALAVGVGLGTNLDRVGPGATREVATVSLNALPGWPGSSGQAVVEEDRDGNRTLVVTVTSPEPASGPREVWMSTPTAEPMIAMGYLQDGRGRFPIAPSVDLQQFRLVDVSQEPAGDQDFRHSGDSMVRGKLPV